MGEEWLPLNLPSFVGYTNLNPVSTVGSDVLRVQPLILPFLGPNELSIRDSTVINALLGTSGLPKGPRTPLRLLTSPLSAILMYLMLN